MHKKLLLSALLVSAGIISWHFIQTAKPSLEEISAIHKSALEHSGISQGGVDAMMSTDPNDLISINELPGELRATISDELEKERLNGFGEVSDFHANEIVNIDNYIIGSDFSEATISFQPSELPNHLFENYEYVGYTHPNYSIKKSVRHMKNGTLRRVFKKFESDQILIVEESSDAGSPAATLIKEAVNASVSKMPAIFGIKKSPNRHTYASLNWTSEKIAYTLYQTSDIEQAKESLIQLGDQLSIENR